MIILRIRTFSSKDSGDVKVYMPGGAKKIKDLSDKQLENIIKFESPKSQRNVKENSLKSIAGLTLVPSGVYYGLGKLTKCKEVTLKKAGIMSLAGAGLGAGISQVGYMHHKKEVKAAKEELQRRKDGATKSFSVLGTALTGHSGGYAEKHKLLQEAKKIDKANGNSFSALKHTFGATNSTLDAVKNGTYGK